MKYIYSFVALSLILMGDVFGQEVKLNEYSQFSGYEISSASSSRMIQTENGYVLNLFIPDSIRNKNMVYNISTKGETMDSLQLNPDSINIFEYPISYQDRFYLLGILWDPELFYSQRYFAREYNDELEVMNSFEGPINKDLARGVFTFWQTGDGYGSHQYQFSMYNDTILGTGNYLVVDSPLVFQGRSVDYFKANMNGEVYYDKALPITSYYNSFFKGSQLYIQGSIPDPDEPGRPKSVGLFDHRGEYIDSWDFDNRLSGAFPSGSVGGVLGDRLYFSYVSLDPALEGCLNNNVAIDVRTTNFEIIKRFKIAECGYLFCGNMPFAEDNEGNIYFQAVSSSYKTIIIQKYDPDMELIWSEEFSFEDEDFFAIPLQIFATQDGGVLLHVRRELNGASRIEIYNFHPDSIDVSNSEVVTSINTPESYVLGPNPCQSGVYYTGPHQQAMSVKLIDTQGILRKETVLDGNFLNLNDLPTGLYRVLMYDLEDKGLLHSQTIVKL